MAKKKAVKDKGISTSQTDGAFGNRGKKDEKDIFDIENIDVQETYSKAEKFINDNKLMLFGVVGLLFLLIGGYYAYTNIYLPPKEANASQEALKAQEYFGIDSFNLALNGDGNYDGFLDIADIHSGTKIGNLANYYAGICLLNLKQYDESIEYLSKFKGDDMIVSSMALGAIGDAYMQLDDADKGIEYYEKAAANSDNHFSAPMYHYRAALAKQNQGDTDGAIRHFETIKKMFPESSEAVEADKYISKLANK